ncbi:hypothetical protein MauCBS54593_004664, partial [Microsporum audouinii]
SKQQVNTPIMGLKGSLKSLAEGVTPKAIAKLTAEFPGNVTTKNNVVKTVNLRIDLHKHMTQPDWATAKVQANTQATDQGVKEFIKKGNKGSHSGTHKTIIEIPFNRRNFDENNFKSTIEQAYKACNADDDNGEESSKGKKDKK